MFNLKRKKIVIFGTGSGGISAYKNQSSFYKIIGFIDNNKNKHGKQCCGKAIYSPDQLFYLSYDFILIASDYYKDIVTQLNDEYKISNDKIIYFNSSVKTSPSQISHKFSLIVDFILNRLPFVFASCCYKILKILSKRYEGTELLPIKWLDNVKTKVVKNLYPQHEYTIYGPNFLDRQQTIAVGLSPDINAYLLRKVITTSTSRSWKLDDEVIVERVPYVNPNITDYASGQIRYHGKHFALVHKYNTSSLKQGICITGCSDTNYYHCLIEVLPQLLLIKKLPDDFKSFPVLISAQLLKIPSLKSALQCINITNQVIELKSNQQYKIEDLIVFSSPNLMLTHLKETDYSPVESSYFNRELLHSYRRTIISYLKNSMKLTTTTPKYIFLARKGVIRTYNQDEVVQLLQSFNFSVIYLEELSLVEQVSYMQGADIIISPSGAGLANLIFTQENTQVLYWAASSNGDASCFSNIANIMNITLDCIGYDVNSSSTRETYHLPYVIDCDLIRQWLNRALSNREKKIC